MTGRLKTGGLPQRQRRHGLPAGRKPIQSHCFPFGQQNAVNQLIFDFARSDYPGFDKFLGTANRELIYVLQQAQDQFVYVWGQRGSGKSHLLKAWVAQAREQGHHAVYIDAETAPLDETALSAEYLAVDGADRLQADEQALLFEIFNRFRNGARGRLLLSADVPPQQLTGQAPGRRTGVAV